MNGRSPPLCEDDHKALGDVRTKRWKDLGSLIYWRDTTHLVGTFALSCYVTNKINDNLYLILYTYLGLLVTVVQIDFNQNALSHSSPSPVYKKH
jgi:hypothetical protein